MKTRMTCASRASVCGRRSKENSETMNVAEQSVTRESSEVTRPLVHCQTTLFWRFNQIGKIFEKSRWTVTRQLSDGYATVGWQSTILLRRFSKNGQFCQKSRWAVTRQSSEVTRPSVECQTTFFDVSTRMAKFWKSRWSVTRHFSDGQATVGWLPNNFISTFQQKWQIFWKKSTERSRDSRRKSCDRRPTVKQLFFRRFKLNNGNFLKKVAERSRDSRPRSGDRRPTVEQPLSTFRANQRKIW